MKKLEQALYEMHFYGFTIIENVLDKKKISLIKNCLIKYSNIIGTEQNFLGTAKHVSNLTTLDQIFLELIDNHHVMPILENILGDDLILGSLNGRIVRPQDGFQELHSDINHNLLNSDSPVMCNTIWMIDDFYPSNGSTRIVPGSHKSGLSGPPKNFEVKHIHQVNAEAGSVLIFNGQCWHGGGNNTTNLNRHGIFGHYRKNGLIFQVDPHDGFPKEWFQNLTNRQKNLLRMKNGVGSPHSADSHLKLSFSYGNHDEF